MKCRQSEISLSGCLGCLLIYVFLYHNQNDALSMVIVRLHVMALLSCLFRSCEALEPNVDIMWSSVGPPEGAWWSAGWTQWIHSDSGTKKSFLSLALPYCRTSNWGGSLLISKRQPCGGCLQLPHGQEDQRGLLSGPALRWVMGSLPASHSLSYPLVVDLLCLLTWILSIDSQEDC